MLDASDRERRSEDGASFLELMAAISIVGVAMLVMLQQLSISHRESESSRDRVYAYQKALAILSELQAAVDRGAIRNANQLESTADLDDSFTLTTLRDENGALLPPEHPSSGNLPRGDGWLWSRRIEVSPFPGNPKLRRVQVSVRKVANEQGGRQTLAAVAILLNLPDESGPTTQLYDVYVLAANAVPSTYMALPSLRQAFAAAVDEIAQRAPGLKFRLHWIAELGYGRDPGYVPYLNTANGATHAAPYVYWYPSSCDQVSPALFAPELFGAAVRTDAGILHGFDATSNPHPFTVADQFNHAHRLPRARAIFEEQIALGRAKRDEPPLQILLEDMHTQPERYRNAIFVNLHGEILPCPPLRNFADPARDPIATPGLRVVTHPARIRTDRDPDGDGDHADSRDLELRVHAWRTQSAGQATTEEPITLRIFGVDLTRNVNAHDSGYPATLEIRRLVGGVDPVTGAIGGGDVDYHPFDSAPGLPPRLADREHPFEMAYEVGFVDGAEPYTWIRLHGTPTTAPAVGTRGLLPISRLYGQEYIPSPVATAPPGVDDFVVDLATEGMGPKNTARWRIRIPKLVFEPSFDGVGLAREDAMLRIETRIGTALDSGVMWPTPNRPWAVSETYAWWAQSPLAVPLTERYQFVGDPRHNPYADLCRDGTSFANGYNWHFDDLRTPMVDGAADWPCLHAERLRDGFDGVVSFDVPRFAQVWRSAMLQSSVVLTCFGGRSIGAFSIGGDLCLPAEPGEFVPRQVPVHGAFYGILGGYAAVDTLTAEDLANPAAPGVPAAMARLGEVVVTGATGGFVARPWLGEIFPDGAAAQWLSSKNLSTNPSAGGFHRRPRHLAVFVDSPIGTSLDQPRGARVGPTGASTLLQFGTSYSTFAQREEPATSMALPAESLRSFVLAAGVGLAEQVPVRWTHGLSETLNQPLPHLQWTDEFPDHHCQELERFARGPAMRSSSAVLQMRSIPGDQRAFLSVIGEVPVGSLEQQRLVRSVALIGLHSLWVAAHPAFDNGIAPMPRVLFVGPEQGVTLRDPGSILLKWRVLFERYDGARYTNSYPESVNGSESVQRYRVLVSSDVGLTWQDAQTLESVDPTARPEPADLIFDSGIGDESIILPTSASAYPAGSYVFRVVVHQANRHSHIAWHDLFVTIARTAEAPPPMSTSSQPKDK
jgi:hypothetical protein